jgi:hypothetical protein
VFAIATTSTAAVEVPAPVRVATMLDFFCFLFFFLNPQLSKLPKVTAAALYFKVCQKPFCFGLGLTID